MRTVKVNLENRSYQVVVGAGILGQAGSWLKEVGIGGRLVNGAGDFGYGLVHDSLVEDDDGG